MKSLFIITALLVSSAANADSINIYSQAPVQQRAWGTPQQGFQQPYQQGYQPSYEQQEEANERRYQNSPQMWQQQQYGRQQNYQHQEEINEQRYQTSPQIIYQRELYGYPYQSSPYYEHK
jgi:hypothetical protein